MTRTYNLEAVVEAHRAAVNGGSWTRLSDMEYDAIVGAAMRSTVEPNAPQIDERWRYKPNRGYGTFVVVQVVGQRVVLRDARGKIKRISLRTLRGDYERVAAGA